MFPFIRDAADAWSETPTPLNLINCPSNSCSLVVRAYHADDGNGGSGGCIVWDSNGYCAPNQGYVKLNIGCTGNTCGPQETTPRYNKWIVMHELATRSASPTQLGNTRSQATDRAMYKLAKPAGACLARTRATLTA